MFRSFLVCFHFLAMVLQGPVKPSNKLRLAEPLAESPSSPAGTLTHTYKLHQFDKTQQQQEVRPFEQTDPQMVGSGSLVGGGAHVAFKSPPTNPDQDFYPISSYFSLKSWSCLGVKPQMSWSAIVSWFRLVGAVLTTTLGQDQSSPVDEVEAI